MLSSKLVAVPEESAVVDKESCASLQNGSEHTSNGAADSSDGSSRSPTKLKVASKLRKDKAYQLKLLEDGSILQNVPVTCLQ